MNDSISKKLHTVLYGTRKQTIGNLLTAFEEKSFAFIFVLLMALPALPIPTGGLVHVFEVIVVFLAIQLVIGRQSLWLPQFLAKKPLPKTLRDGILKKLNTYIMWVEQHSKRRAAFLVSSRWAIAFHAISIIVFTAFAFFAPPFTGLDTLPSLGVVVMSLAIILDDGLILLLGYLIGIIGCVVVVGLGAGVVTAVGQLFSIF